MTPRLKCAVAGLALLVLTPLISKWSIFDVLEKARAHAPEVSWSEKAPFVVPLGLFGGVAALVIAAMPSLWVGFQPNRMRRFADLAPMQKVLAVGGALMMVGAGFALRAWFVGELQALGYDVTSV